MTIDNAKLLAFEIVIPGSQKTCKIVSIKVHIFSTRRLGLGGGGGFSFDACLSHLTIDHAFLSTRHKGNGRIRIFTGSTLAGIQCKE